MTTATRVLMTSPRRQLVSLGTALRLFGRRGWAAAVAGGIGTLLVVGLGAALIDNPVFGRQLAAREQDYVFWAITAVLGGLIIGTYALAPMMDEGKAASGGFLSFIAVGCPICNKVAVGLLGTTGALNAFGSSQLFIGLASVALLGWTLLIRAQAVVEGCPVDGAIGQEGNRAST